MFKGLILVLPYLVTVVISIQIFDLLSFFLFIRCVGMGGLCGALRLQVLHAVFRSE